MIRLLHIHDPRTADLQTTRAIEHLTRDLGQGFNPTPFTLGPAGDAPHIPSAILALRHRAPFTDVVHAWGFAALSAAAFCPFRHVLFTPTAWPRPRQLRWLRAILHYRDLHVICPSATLRRTLVERGIPLERCHLIRPGVDFSRLRPRADARQVRAALGVEEGHDLWLLPGESTRAADHRQGVWAATIVNILSRRTRVLVWGRGPLTPALKHFAARLNQPELFIPAQERLGRAVEFEELLPAADVMVVPATGPIPTLPIAIGMANGLPSVAAVTPTVAELLEDRHTALMTQPNVPRLLARRVLDLNQDAGLRWQLTDTARTEAYEFFSLTRFLDQYRQAYRQASAGEPLDIPEPNPGAGQRFAVRG